MDFLSYLILKKTQRPISSVCVLNSVNQLNKAMGFIGKHDTIHVFADNDEAGNRMLKTIESTQKTVIDQRAFYKNYKDLNEYLCDKQDMPKQNIKSGFRKKM